MDGQTRMTKADKAVLELAFGGPLSIMQRVFGLFGVSVAPAPAVDDDFLSGCEADARSAIGSYWRALAVLVVNVPFAVVVWFPLTDRLGHIVNNALFAGVADTAMRLGVGWQTAGMLAFGVTTAGLFPQGALIAVLAVLPSFVALRACALATSSVTSLALRVRDEESPPALLSAETAYPYTRVALTRLLGGKPQAEVG